MIKKITFITLLFSFTLSASSQRLFLAPAKKDGLWGFINQNGKTVIPLDFQEAKGFSQGLAAVKINDSWIYINVEGSKVVTDKFEEAFSFKNGIARVKKAGYWYYINRTGIPITKERFDYAYDFSNNLGLVFKNGFYGYLLENGDYSISPQFSKADDFHNGIAKVAKNNQWYFLHKSEMLTLVPANQWIGKYNEYGLVPWVNQKGRLGFLDEQGNKVITAEFKESKEFSESSVAVANASGKWGFIDEQGNYFIEPVFEDAGEFTNDLAPIKIKERYGYIDINGEIAIEPKFEAAASFDENVAKVKLNRKYGLIDYDGDFVVEPKYSFISDFANGFAVVKNNGLYGAINELGEEVVAMTWNELKSFSMEDSKPIAQVRPIITFKAMPKITKEENILVTATVTSSSEILDCFIVVNDDEYPYQLLGKKGTRTVKQVNQNNHTEYINHFVPLRAGVNTIYIKAVNKAGEKLSSVQEVIYEYAKPNLHALVIGVAEHKPEQYNLQYSDKDANDLAYELELQNNLPVDKRIFENIYVHTLVNEEATTAYIKKSFLDIKREVNKGDVFLLFFSGHGHNDTKGDFYLRTYDTDAELKYLSVNGLQYEWMDRQILDLDCIDIRIVDACHSAGNSSKNKRKMAIKNNGNDLDQVINRSEALLAQYNHKSSFHFYSSLNFQTSIEHIDWENGAFTQAVLDCFTQKKYRNKSRVFIPDANQDGQVDTAEFYNYISAVTGLLTENNQTPRQSISAGGVIPLFSVQ